MYKKIFLAVFATLFASAAFTSWASAEAAPPEKRARDLHPHRRLLVGVVVEIVELGGLWEIVEIYPYRLTDKQLRTRNTLILA